MNGEILYNGSPKALMGIQDTASKAEATKQTVQVKENEADITRNINYYHPPRLWKQAVLHNMRTCWVVQALLCCIQ